MSHQMISVWKQGTLDCLLMRNFQFQVNIVWSDLSQGYQNVEFHVGLFKCPIESKRSLTFYISYSIYWTELLTLSPSFKGLQNLRILFLPLKINSSVLLSEFVDSWPR